VFLKAFLVLMLKLRIIPTILKNSAVVVKGKNFSKSRVIGPLLPLLKVYQSRDVDELIIIDVSPKKSNNEERFEWLSNVTSFTTMPLSVGGGIKTLSQASRIIELGADKVILNSVIQENPSLITSIAEKHGSQSIIASIDVIRFENKFLLYDSWSSKHTSEDILETIKIAQEYGAGEIFLTSVSREGCRMGFDFNLLNYVKDKINIPLIYHGGASNKEDFLSIIDFANKKNIRLDALAAGSCFQFSSLTPAEVAEFLHLANIPVRQIHNNF
tara:strand:- start:176 stop:988 length:813 start_codon:yes stop_codon:yes gene_type:complete